MIARLESGYPLLAGVVAALTGLGMIALPGAFYGSYGIDPAASIDLANELRSPGLWLALIGFIIARGALRPDMRRLPPPPRLPFISAMPQHEAWRSPRTVRPDPA